MKAGQKPPNYGRKFPAQVLSSSDLAKLLTACDQYSRGEITRWRNRALVIVLWRVGLRISEALGLTVADVDMDRRELHVRKAKTKAGIRTVGLDAMTYEALALWLENRPRDTEWLFVSTKQARSGGGQLAYTTTAEMFKRLARLAGIKQRVAPHGLRHTFATEMHREGVPLAVLSHALGHKDSATTLHYAQHVLSRLEVAQAMQQRTAPSNGVQTSEPPTDLQAIAAQVAELGAMLKQAVES
jgi:integrase/recombinase XerD